MGGSVNRQWPKVSVLSLFATGATSVFAEV
jgi:hypothetical protein